jgi:hypothetical protein
MAPRKEICYTLQYMMAKPSETTAANTNEMMAHAPIVSPLLVVGIGALLGTGMSLDFEPKVSMKVHFLHGLGCGIIGLGTYGAMHTFYQDDHYSAAALFMGSRSAIGLGAGTCKNMKLSIALKHGLGGSLTCLGIYGAF